MKEPSRIKRRLIRWGSLVLAGLLPVILLNQCTLRMSDSAIQNYFSKQAIKPTFHHIAIAGRSLHYAHIGADTLPPVVFIHGSPGSWDAFISFFADSGLYQQAQLLSVDRLGFGKSGLGNPEPSLARQAAAIAPILQQVSKIKPPILVGHSLGGPIAARLAMDYPQWVGGLVLVAPSIDPALEKQEWYRPVGAAIPIRWLLPAELDVSNREILPLKAELEAMLPLWASIRVPVTVIQGDADELVPAGNAWFAQRMLSHAAVNLRLLPGMNHFIPWRRPDTIREAILMHLNGRKSLPAKKIP
ncbi:alpha/beta hydrolase [Spirosoma sp. SC4-14]|uniref:alpha/beta fold hydrolase n=1 Tax=Spirosoma sp. SC4-14 TaxID=3128900 RepID=UPI0030D494BF